MSNRLTALQLVTLRRMSDGRVLYVPVHGVSYATARSLLRRGLAREVILSEWGDSAGSWGIAITEAGRDAATRTIREGDVVRAVRNVGAPVSERVLGTMTGVVTKVTPVLHGSGGTMAHVRVRWEGGSEGRHEDRGLCVVEENNDVS